MNDLLDPQDASHLDLLGVFYYVFAGLCLFGVCFPIIHLSVGIAMVTGSFGGSADAPPPELGFFFIAIALLIMAGSAGIGVLYYLTGKKLRAREGHTFCFVVAALTCMSVPLGTILGVFTIIVLNRPGVREAFS